MTTKRGPLIIVSGPSGSGKSTLIRRVLAQGGVPLRLSVSATTRPPRPGEREGVDYYFWTTEQFERGIQEGAFLEHAQVHGKHYYGTLLSEIDGYRGLGVGVLLDIDYQGARQVRPTHPEVVSVFVRAPRLEDYEARLRFRDTEDEATIARRLATAREELEHVDEYNHVVINDDLERAYGELRDWIARQF